MQRLTSATEALGLRLLARQSQPLCSTFLETASCRPQALSQSTQCSACWTSTSTAGPLRGFSSQNAAAPEPDPSTEHNSPQALARITPKDMMAMFTCNKCKTRSAKLFSKQTYETGVVIVRCPGCDGDHLIADRLGWFGEPGSIENYLQAQGQEVMKRTVDGMTQLTAEDLMGWSKAQSGLASLQHRAHIGNITAGLTKSSDLVNLGLALGATGLDAPAAARQPAVLAVTCSGHRPSCT